MDNSTKFWDKVALRYSKKPVVDEESYQKKLQITRKYFRADMEVLELGCGTGSTAIAHAPHVKHIRAIDISLKMLDIAKTKTDKENITNITFEQNTVDDFSANDHSLDMILALSLLHLVEDKEELIAKIYKALKPGGIFISSTMCLGDTMKFFKFIAPIGKFFSLLPLIKVFSKYELQSSITDAGFSIDHFWHPGKGKAVFIVAKKE